jgi:hypothetical protein
MKTNPTVTDGSKISKFSAALPPKRTCDSISLGGAFNGRASLEGALLELSSDVPYRETGFSP